MNETHHISAICLNKCWINDIDSMTGLNFKNYQMFFQPGNRQGHSHCGLVIYVQIKLMLTVLELNLIMSMYL